MAAEGHVRRRSVYADRLLDFPEIVFSDAREFSKRGRWREHFGLDKLIFEIGCNDGILLRPFADPRVGHSGPDARPACTCDVFGSVGVRIGPIPG